LHSALLWMLCNLQDFAALDIVMMKNNAPTTWQTLHNKVVWRVHDLVYCILGGGFQWCSWSCCRSQRLCSEGEVLGIWWELSITNVSNHFV